MPAGVGALRAAGARARGRYVRLKRRHERDRALARLRAHPDPAVAAVGRALTAAIAPPSGPERGWIERIEGLREELGRSREVIRASRSEWTGDPGDRDRVRESPVARLALETSKPARWGRVLLHLNRELAPGRALELGTCLGLSTAYQAAGLELAGGEGGIATMEAGASRLELAMANLERLELAGRVEPHPGRFEETLDGVLESGELRFAFIDGHHRFRPTLAYFERITARMHLPGVVLFDDITWSKGMRRAWAEITSDPRVALAIDLHGLGLCVVDDPSADGGGERRPALSFFLHP